ncbi:acetyl-CoA synthetase-like protein [Desarmillaria tabescens]|uniref:Acetyl-CoA synthetase-like protein n=1 Tax=Armillaria tabescens TaxID=1929756 RepID=A0AA39T5H9_ARMTA|nr:acetyl-CoA synthetase-like protein [Desarmillaria tabescens]KAK0465926.1 acetyl-CoA synthetase-like protein [Desarmillaria tabescens]
MPQNALPSPLLSCAPRTCDLDREHLVLEWLFDHAAKRPDAIAHEIYTSMEKPPFLLTYGEYNRQSNILARWLVANGIHIEDKVALCSPRTPHFYIIMAAILKAGGCYVSIDPELPTERKRFIVEDSGARRVFAAPEDASIFGDVAVPITTAFMEQLESDFSDSNICLATLPSLAYLLYTSGTTGNPKGCLLTHRGLFWAMDAFCALPKPVTNPDTDKRLALASTAFDVHISEIVQSWCLGSRLVSAPRFELLTQLRRHIISIGVTHIGMVPSMIEALLESPDGLPIKYLVSGGEKITDSLLKKWSARPDLVLANFYGPTEATIGCTSRQIGLNDRKENIGRAFPSCSAYVVDRDLNTVPLGCPGELVISGPLVARGYHNLPDVTSKVFIDYPTPGCTAYRTGDLVRMMPDHSIEIMGRIDSQVKYRGVRIETEGISSILQAAGGVKKLTVSTFITTHPAVGTQELLVSFFAFGNDVSVVERRSSIPSLVQTDEAKALVQTLKAAVQVQLPAYMRPAYILPVEFIPLSLNGKTDTKVLARVLGSLDMRALLGN